MAVLTVVVLWRVNAQVSSVGWVEHTDQVLRRTKDAQLSLRDMSIAMHSYWLSADESYLVEFRNADQELTNNLGIVSALVADNPAEGRRLLEVSNLKGAWIGSIQMLMKQANGSRPDRNLLTQLNSQLQAASDVLNQIVDEEDRLFEQRLGRQKDEDRLIFVLVPLLSTIGAVALSYWGLREIDRASRKFAAAVAKAEEANRAKDNFLATVSHELRNPLNSILLATGVLASDHEISNSARQRVKAIERAARTQAQLIEDLLDISRIESGRLRLDVQATDLARVVKAAVDAMHVAAEAKSITLHHIIDTNVSPIAGDPNRLEQVVWNLISNAVKFTPKGGKVQVRLERINSHVEIVVTDNGHGIARSSLPYLFDRFWQELESGQSRPGIGLGLSIVKEIVALHGGTVMAHSDGIGTGSAFTVRLPVPPASTPLLEPRHHPTIGAADSVAPAARLDGLSLLVVDDDAETCEALTNLLSSLGATVCAQASVEGALRVLAGARPDVIIADIEMPVQDGFFLAREIRKREHEHRSSDRVPMLALTAYGRVEDKVKILASGFDSHVVKPVDLAELSATIRSLVAARTM
jgi:signal transduction histidine kinase/ActR/RegA family two-component response regulator